MLGKVHSALAAHIDREVTENYQAAMKGAADSARSVVWRKELRAWEIERAAELRREREQQRPQPDRGRDRDYGPGR